MIPSAYVIGAHIDMDGPQRDRTALSVRMRILWLTSLSLVAVFFVGAGWIWGSSVLQIFGGLLGMLCASGWAFLMMERGRGDRRQ